MNIHALYARISPHFRRRRIAWLLSLLKIKSTDRILDIGGYPWCWDYPAIESHITLVNLHSVEKETVSQKTKFTFVQSDGCQLPFRNGEFEVVFSNSVIEHVGSWTRQQAFAEEARRIGGKLWVQTPAREFFIEPHLLAPFVHWLPLNWQRRLIRNFTSWGWITRPDKIQVDAFLSEVRLLTYREMTLLFPDCEILREKFLGITKSYVAIRRA